MFLVFVSVQETFSFHSVFSLRYGHSGLVTFVIPASEPESTNKVFVSSMDSGSGSGMTEDKIGMVIPDLIRNPVKYGINVDVDPGSEPGMTVFYLKPVVTENISSL